MARVKTHGHQNSESGTLMVIDSECLENDSDFAPTDFEKPRKPTRLQVRGAIIGAIIGDAFGAMSSGLKTDEIITTTGGFGFSRPGRMKSAVDNRWFESHVTENTRLLIDAVNDIAGKRSVDHESLATIASRVGCEQATIARIAVAVGLFHALRSCTPQQNDVVHAANAAEDVKKIGALVAAERNAVASGIAVATALVYAMTSPELRTGKTNCGRIGEDELTSEIERNIDLYDGCHEFAEAVRLVKNTLNSALTLRKTVGTDDNPTHGVPFGIGCFLRNPDNPEMAILEAVNGGGDAAGNAFIAGALAGCNTGENSIPIEWKKYFHAVTETATHIADRLHLSLSVLT